MRVRSAGTWGTHSQHGNPAAGAECCSEHSDTECSSIQSVCPGSINIQENWGTSANSLPGTVLQNYRIDEVGKDL